VDVLVDEGLIVRRHGVGTFVAPGRLAEPMIGLHSMRDLAQAFPGGYTVEILDRVLEPANANEQARLGITGDELVLRYWRRDVLAGLPVCLARISLLGRFAEQLDLEALKSHSTYHLLESRCGVRPISAHQAVRAEAAGLEIARGLAIPRGQPVLAIDRVTRDDNNAPIEWGLLRYRHDRIEYTMDLLQQQTWRDSARVVPFHYLRPEAGHGRTRPISRTPVSPVSRSKEDTLTWLS